MSYPAEHIPPDEHCPEADRAPMTRSAPPPVTLTPEQSKIRADVLRDLLIRKEREVTLGGYAGTGKTTLIRTLLDALKGFAVCAYTGKAANVLRRKGVPASTIHSLIYQPDDSSGVTRFVLKPPAALAGVQGFVVDEASMVSDVIYRDLCTFGLPILFVGDHGQLEPVGSDFNLMAAPKYRLETIHRNAGAIAQFAEGLRHRGLAAERPESPEITFVKPADLTVPMMAEADQVCVGLNATRVKANAAIRQSLGRTALVEVGDRVMCLRNNRDYGVFNGLQATVTALVQNGKHPAFDLEAHGVTWRALPYEPGQFGQVTAPPFVKGATTVPFDYAYAATCHKLQGDEADTVLVIVQQVGNCDMRRWAYTAATRARKHLVWVAS